MMQQPKKKKIIFTSQTRLKLMVAMMWHSTGNMINLQGLHKQTEVKAA